MSKNISKLIDEPYWDEAMLRSLTTGAKTKVQIMYMDDDQFAKGLIDIIAGTTDLPPVQVIKRPDTTLSIDETKELFESLIKPIEARILHEIHKKVSMTPRENGMMILPLNFESFSNRNIHQMVKTANVHPNYLNDRNVGNLLIALRKLKGLVS